LTAKTFHFLALSPLDLLRGPGRHKHENQSVKSQKHKIKLTINKIA
jgi:hypothetical protein